MARGGARRGARSRRTRCCRYSTGRPRAARACYFVENRDLPMLDLSVEFPAGAGYDTPEKSGVASMTNHLLQLGRGRHERGRDRARLADVGAQLAGRFDTDHAGLAVRTLSSAKERGQALDTFARILPRPEFPRGGARAREGAADRRAEGGRYPARHDRLAQFLPPGLPRSSVRAALLGRSGDGARRSRARTSRHSTAATTSRSTRSSR